MAANPALNPEPIVVSTGTVVTFMESLSREAWIGIFFALLGIIVSVILYVLSRQRKALHWCYHGTLLLGTAHSELPDGITVQYEGQAIARLTRTRIWIWNPTDKTIHDSDLESSDPVRINFDSDGQVLAAMVLTSHRPVTNFQASAHPISATDVPISFNFLDKHDGAVIEVLHTGTDIKPSLLGTIRGIPKGPKYRGPVTDSLVPSRGNRKRRRYAQIITRVMITTLFVSGVALLGLSLTGLRSTSPFIENPKLQLVIGGVGYIIMAVFLAYRSWWRRYPKSLHVTDS